LELLNTSLDINKKRVEVAVENGTAFKSDIDVIQVEIIKANQKIDELRFNRTSFVTVLSLMTSQEISSDDEFIRPPGTDKYVTLGINRPELALLNNRLTLLQAQEQIQKATLYPKVGVMGFATFIQPGANFGTSQIENVLVAGLSLNWRIAELYRNNNNKKLTEVNLRKVEVQREAFLFNTNLGLSQLNNELLKLASLIEQDRDILRLKGNIRKSYDVKYENGVSTMSELLDKVNDESVARQQLVLHEIQYLKKLYEYQNLSGN